MEKIKIENKTKWLVIAWDDNSTEIQPSNEVICENNIEPGCKVSMQWKQKLWNGIIDSVWDMLVMNIVI